VVSGEPKVSVTNRAQLLESSDGLLKKTRNIDLYVESSLLLVCINLKCFRKYCSKVSWFVVLDLYLINCYS